MPYGEWNSLALNRSGRSLIALSPDGEIVQPVVVYLVTGSRRRITSHGDAVKCVPMAPTGERIATGDRSGVVRVGLATGEEPHLLLGHSGVVTEVGLSADGKWVASASSAEIFLWPVPDLSRPPAHTLPLTELLEKLESQTNLRAVSDPAAPGGYRLVPGPFPGWANVPEWQP